MVFYLLTSKLWLKQVSWKMKAHIVLSNLILIDMSALPAISVIQMKCFYLKLLRHTEKAISA